MKLGMRVQWAVPVIVSILILGTFGVQQVFAPDEQPEKLTLGGAGYDDETENIEIDMSVQFGMVKAIQNADFSISVELTITSTGLPGGSLSFAQNFSGEEIFPDEVGRIKVQFHWDRSLPDGSTFEEIAVDTTTTAQILNPSGKPIPNGSDTIDETVDFDSR